MTDDWRVLDLPGGGLTLRYPAVTGSGQPVSIDDVRVHLQSLDGNELYLEVSRHLGAATQPTYEQERAFLGERLAAEVGPLEPTTFAGHEAQAFSFTFSEKQRTIVLVERDGWLFRVVYDPSSALDLAVLETVTLG